MYKILDCIIRPSKILIKLDNLKIIKLSDINYTKIKYRLKTGEKLNLKNPENFNEKLQWLKLYDRNLDYAEMVDKVLVKDYVAKVIGKEYIIPTIGVYSSFKEINFDKLPNKFVMKCNHDSGGVFVCREKNELNLEKVNKLFTQSLSQNYYRFSREWQYKDVEPKIIIEKYMEDKSQKVLRDYKFYCFNGKVKYLSVSDGMEDHKTARIGFFDVDFNKAPFSRKDYLPLSKSLSKPLNFDKMIKFSEIFSKNVPFLRVDFYEINNKLYFGELTLCPCSGMIPFDLDEWNYKLGEMLSLPTDKKI